MYKGETRCDTQRVAPVEFHLLLWGPRVAGETAVVKTEENGIRARHYNLAKFTITAERS